jgi:hypothetical protein
MGVYESVLTIDRLVARGWKVRIKPVRWWLPWGVLTATLTPPPGFRDAAGDQITQIVATSRRRGLWLFIDAVDRYW